MGYIYSILNNITNKIYIGKSVRAPKLRIAEHFKNWELLNTNSKLTNAILQYGNDVWSYDIIEECDDNILDEREKYWISFYDSYNNGYNSTLGGDGLSRYVFNKDDILEQYLNGVSAKDIALQYGCHYHYIHEILQDFGIDTSLRKSKQKPIACFDRDKNLIDIFNCKKDIQNYLLNYGYGKSLCNVAHFVSETCRTSKLVYKRYWVLVTNDNIEYIRKLPKCGVHEYSGVNRTSNSSSYYKAIYVSGETFYFKEFRELAIKISNGNSVKNLQYRLKKSFETQSIYKGFKIMTCTEDEYNSALNKL